MRSRRRMLRGGGTKDAKEFLKKKKFHYDISHHAWEQYLWCEDLTNILRELKAMGFNIKPKDGMDKEYILDGFEGKRKLKCYEDT